jgi:hypothetical protein
MVGVITSIAASTPHGVFAVLDRCAVVEQRAEQLRQLLLTLSGFAEEVSEIHFLGVDDVTVTSHVAALAFVLDKQPTSVGVEYQTPSVLIGAFAALIQWSSQQSHAASPAWCGEA